MEFAAAAFVVVQRRPRIQQLPPHGWRPGWLRREGTYLAGICGETVASLSPFELRATSWRTASNGARFLCNIRAADYAARRRLNGREHITAAAIKKPVAGSGIGVTLPVPAP